MEEISGRARAKDSILFPRASFCFSFVLVKMTFGGFFFGGRKKKKKRLFDLLCFCSFLVLVCTPPHEVAVGWSRDGHHVFVYCLQGSSDPGHPSSLLLPTRVNLFSGTRGLQ